MSNEKSCPFCAETIKAAAIKCRYCGESLNSDPRLTNEADSGSEPGFSLALPSLAVIVGICLFGYATAMDVTVAVENNVLGIERVANIHLIAQQKNYQMAGAFLTLLGLIFGWFVRQSGNARIGKGGWKPARKADPEDALVYKEPPSLPSLPKFEKGEVNPAHLFGLMCVIFLCFLSVVYFMPRSTPRPSPPPQASAEDIEREARMKALDTALAELEEETKSKLASKKEENSEKAAQRNQCFHRDQNGNRICKEPQKVGLYCAKHDPSLPKAAVVPEPEPEVAETWEDDYDYGQYEDYTYTPPPEANMGDGPKYPTGAGNSDSIDFLVSRCLHTEPSGKKCSMKATNGLRCKYHQR